MKINSSDLSSTFRGTNPSEKVQEKIICQFKTLEIHIIFILSDAIKVVTSKHMQNVQASWLGIQLKKTELKMIHEKIADYL